MNMKKDEQSAEVKEWLKKIEGVKKGEMDLSIDEDLSIALMNLVSLEEHFYFTAMKLKNQKYLDLMKSVRALRTSLLKKIVTDPKGEEWCISKHLLASSMRLYEVGTKEYGRNNAKEANAYFTSAFDMYSLFFAINMKMVGAAKLEEQVTKESSRSDKKGNALLSGFSAVVKKVLDCCKEW